jgi:hypothetical protein
LYMNIIESNDKLNNIRINRPYGRSLDHHRIAVTEKAISPGNRQPIKPALLFDAHHRGDQGDQGAAWKMKIRHQRLHVLPGIGGADEDVGLGGFRREGQRLRLAFQNAGGGRADGDDAPALGFSSV